MDKIEIKKKEYDKKNHISFSKKYKSKERTNANEEVIKKLEELEKLTTTKIDVFSTVNEKYAHDLIFMAAILQIAMNIAENKRTKEQQQLVEMIENEKKSDEYFEKRMEDYSDFKTQVKLTKIIEAKLTTPGLNEKDKKSLEEQLLNTKNKIELIVQEMEFSTIDKDEKPLKFDNSADFIKFLDQIESNLFAQSYRLDIFDPQQLNDIYNTETNKLFSLAEETRDNFDNVMSGNLQKNINEILNDLDSTSATTNISL